MAGCVVKPGTEPAGAAKVPSLLLRARAWPLPVPAMEKIPGADATTWRLVGVEDAAPFVTTTWAVPGRTFQGNCALIWS